VQFNHRSKSVDFVVSPDSTPAAPPSFKSNTILKSLGGLNALPFEHLLEWLNQLAQAFKPDNGDS